MMFRAHWYYEPVLSALPRAHSSAWMVQMRWCMAVSQVMTQDTANIGNFAQVGFEVQAAIRN